MNIREEETTINIQDLFNERNEQNKRITELVLKLEKQKEVLDKIEEYLNKVELGELENGKAYTFKDFLKEEKDAEIEEAKWLLELLEEIE